VILQQLAPPWRSTGENKVGPRTRGWGLG
jgi:hypothetical protein